LFFFYGALGDVANASIDWWTADSIYTEWWSLWADVAASSLWLISSIFCFILWVLDKQARRHHNAHIQTRLFMWGTREAEDSRGRPQLYVSDLEGWAMWIYLVASSIYVVGAVLCYYYNDGRCWIVQVTAAGLFLIEGILSIYDSRRMDEDEFDTIATMDETESINIYLRRSVKFMFEYVDNSDRISVLEM